MFMNLSNTCYLSEIYSAIQGEGPLVGIRQIFVRFSICDLRCKWCDTPNSLVKQEYCEVEDFTGSRTFTKNKNPLLLQDVLKYVINLKPELHHSISITGGEPLLQHDFLNEFIPLIKKEGQVLIYLETGGHRPNELKRVIDLVDFVSMDFKLPSSASVKDLWDKHKEFLEVSLNARKKLWIKIVITDETSRDDLITSITLVKSFGKLNKPIEIFLQPVTEQNGSKPPSETKLLDIHMKLLKQYPHIRVLPQVHKLIGQK